MILNEEYYKQLLEKYSGVECIGDNEYDNVVLFSIKMILAYYRKNKPIHINFQGAKDYLFEVGKQLFLEFANDVFLNHYDLPKLKIGDKLRDMRPYHMDKRQHYFVIKKIDGNKFIIEETRNKAVASVEYDKLVENFIPISRTSRQLKEYGRFFTNLNGGKKFDFIPTNFRQKVIYISKKALWEALPNRNRIPAKYLPTPNDGNVVIPTTTIHALEDCVAYFAPNYDIAYQHILLKDEKIKTVVIFNTEADKIEQILQDKQRFGFNLIAITNSFNPIKKESIPCWNWFKEEIKIINAL